MPRAPLIADVLACDRRLLESEPSPASLEAYRSAQQARGVEVDAYERKGRIVLSRIVVPKAGRGQGLGSAAMRALAAYADQTGQTIDLSPSTDFGATSKGRLQAFYRRFGFVPNKGRNKDYTSSESMIRVPRQGT